MKTKIFKRITREKKEQRPGEEYLVSSDMCNVIREKKEEKQKISKYH